MNRENKKRKYDRRYFRTHPCTDSFTCKNCGWPVVSAGAGSSHRNHCPNCLYSVHLDNSPGDRESDCHGRMEPIGVWVRKNGEWAVIHRCAVCGRTELDDPCLEFRFCSKCNGNYEYCQDHLFTHEHVK